MEYFKCAQKLMGCQLVYYAELTEKLTKYAKNKVCVQSSN